MAFNGSGQYVRDHDWTTDLTNLVPVTASRMDTEHDGFATGLSSCIVKDGQQTTTARIPFAAGVGLSDGSAATPALNFTADANSGIYRIGADNIGIGVNGAAVLNVATTGLTVTGALSPSGDFAVATNKFTVASASGNTVVAGTLGVTGATTLSSTADVAGNFSVATNKLTVTAASGNTSIAGTLGVTGAATFTSSISAATVTGAMVATQAQQETGSATNLLVSPGRQHFHQSAAKAWGKITWSAGTPTLQASYNVSGITDDGQGQVTVTFTTAMSSAHYAISASVLQTDSSRRFIGISAQAAGTFAIFVQDSAGNLTDPSGVYFTVHGDI